MKAAAEIVEATEATWNKISQFFWEKDETKKVVKLDQCQPCHTTVHVVGRAHERADHKPPTRHSDETGKASSSEWCRERLDSRTECEKSISGRGGGAEGV